MKRLLPYGSPLRRAWWTTTWRAVWYLLAYQVMGWLLFGAAQPRSPRRPRSRSRWPGYRRWSPRPGSSTPARSRSVRASARCPANPSSTVTASRTRPRPGPKTCGARARAYWKDTATWREFAYLVGMFLPLVVLGCVVLAIWLTLAAGVTLPLWYWAPFDHFPHGDRARRAARLLPQRPIRPRRGRRYVDTLPKALLTALVCLMALVPFSYVLALTARTHATVARALLRSPEDPLAPAKDLSDALVRFLLLSAEPTVLPAPPMRVQLTGGARNRPLAPHNCSVRSRHRKRS